MTAPANNATFYADFKSLAALKHEAKTDSQQALRGAAQQFESLFINMMLKSARESTSSVGDSMTGSNEMDMYQGMFDEQIATQMAKGKGLGLADMLVQQLSRSGMVKSSASTQSQASATDATGGVETKSSGTISSVSSKQTASHVAPGAKATSHRTTASTQTSATQFKSPADFVQKMWPHVQEAAQKLGVDPTTLIAHAALETGWGKHIPCQGDGSSSHNLFGIKAGDNWNGASVGATTLEFSDGVAVKKVDRFKAYDSTAQCFSDYADMLASHTRYSKTLNTGSDAAKFAHALQKGGYATDPDYAHKLKAVARSVMSLINSITSNASAQFANTAQAPSSHADT